MEWKDIPGIWRACFNEAWESFQEGSRPIGALITDKEGNIIARGKSAAFNTLTDTIISNNELAHAEVNALLQLDNRTHTVRNTYTLYSTMEPCPLCFGAFYMSGIRNLQFAAKDKWAGSTNLKNTTPYLSFKPIIIEGPFPFLEQLSILLNIYFDHTLQGGKTNHVTEHMAEDYPGAAALAKTWATEMRLANSNDLRVEDVFTMMQNEITVYVTP